jgi:hypothetical protein
MNLSEFPLLSKIDRLFLYRLGLAVSLLLFILTVSGVITNTNSDINFKRVLDFKRDYEALDSAALRKDSIKIKFKEFNEILQKHKEERKNIWGQMFVNEGFDSLSLEIRKK